jgi:hypothetical protein
VRDAGWQGGKFPGYPVDNPVEEEYEERSEEHERQAVVTETGGVIGL